MRLEPLYRLRFTYPEGWAVRLEGPAGVEEQHFFLVEGRCEGRINGRFRGANHPRRRADGTFVPDLQGVIETDDGAIVFCDHRGYGRAYPPARRQIVGSSTHLSEHERYRWLNDVVCVSAGEVRARPDGIGADLVIDLSELVWEPIQD